MKTNLLSYLSLAVWFFALHSCTSTSTTKFISVEGYTFARTGDNNQLEAVDDPAVFKRGDAVCLVLQNVGPFKKDSTGLHWFDLDMEITGPDDKILFTQTGLLGDRGHIALQNDMASSPNATYPTTPDMIPGKYRFKLTIYDRIGIGKATYSAFFSLE